MYGPTDREKVEISIDIAINNVLNVWFNVGYKCVLLKIGV